ncbi:hypothetical protein [Akkermansia sp.]|uniref:hypothetical protein n=1 Tax=Akkermansia sp. TaxID=1872421 RepID=UPI00399CFD17
MEAENTMTRSFRPSPGKLVFSCIRPFPARFPILPGFLIRHVILSIEHVAERLKKRGFERSGQEGKSTVPASGFAMDFSMGKTA